MGESLAMSTPLQAALVFVSIAFVVLAAFIILAAILARRRLERVATTTADLRVALETLA